jgi:hypothetical protein
MIITLIIVVLVLLLLLYLVQLAPLDPASMRIFQIGLVIIALLWLASDLGLARF